MENKMVSASATVSEKPCLMVKANIVLLKTNLVAAYEKVGSGYKILIKPTDKESNAMTLQEMIDDVNKLINDITGQSGLDKSQISNQIGDFYSDDKNGNLQDDAGNDDLLNSLTISLKQIFLYIDNSGTEKADNTVEYAFDLEIKKDVKLDIGLISFQSISLAIWNSTRQSVLERMDMKKLDELLEDYS